MELAQLWQAKNKATEIEKLERKLVAAEEKASEAYRELQEVWLSSVVSNCWSKVSGSCGV